MAIRPDSLTPGALSLREYDVSEPIAPLGNRKIRVGPGNYFYVSEASHGSFYLVLNDRVTLRGRLALGHVFPENESIVKIEVRNTDATRPLTLRFQVGKGRPLDNGLNVYTEQITPVVRQENPSNFAVVTLVCTGLGNALELVAQDCERAELRMFTNDVGTAFYGPTNDATWPTVNGNQVGLTLEGATKLRTCAPIYVRGEVGTTVYAHVFSY